MINNRKDRLAEIDRQFQMFINTMEIMTKAVKITQNSFNESNDHYLFH